MALDGGAFALSLINLQKAATCAWLFAPLKGQVCAKGVHAAPCKNSKKWLLPLCRHAQKRRHPLWMPSFFEQAYKPGSVYAAIYLGRLLPDASSHLPKTDRASPAPWGAVFLPVLLWIEFTGSPSYLGDRWALTPPFHPYHARHGGISLLHLS